MFQEKIEVGCCRFFRRVCDVVQDYMRHLLRHSQVHLQPHLFHWHQM
jgi:hypothetical protein